MNIAQVMSDVFDIRLMLEQVPLYRTCCYCSYSRSRIGNLQNNNSTNSSNNNNNSNITISACANPTDDNDSC